MEAMIAQRERVRSPVVEGLFYPDDRAAVLENFKNFGLEQGKGGYSQAIIAPHGAWEISGALAAAAFSAAGGRTGEKSPSRVVVMGPIHDRRKEGLFLSNSHFFQTPLGNIPVDQEITEDLESCSPLFEINDIPHLQEHSIEVLLPFIKYCFPHVSVVPILMGQPREPVISALAYALRIIFDPIMEDTLLVISCNFSMEPSETAALSKAEECMRLFTEKKAPELCTAIWNGQINPCGGGIVASLLKSGLVDSLYPRFVSKPMLRTRDEEDNTAYYGALSFE